MKKSIPLFFISLCLLLSCQSFTRPRTPVEQGKRMIDQLVQMENEAKKIRPQLEKSDEKAIAAARKIFEQMDKLQKEARELDKSFNAEDRDQLNQYSNELAKKHDNFENLVYALSRGAQASVEETVRTDNRRNNITVELKPSMSGQEILNKLNNLGDGVTIRFASGEYTLDTGLSFYNMRNCVIEGKGKVRIQIRELNDNVLTLGSCANVIVRNLSLSHQTPVSEHAGGVVDSCAGFVVYSWNGDNILVENCELNGCGSVGLMCRDTRGITARQCNIHDNSSWGVYMESCQNFHLTDSRVINNGSAVFWDRRHIRENTSTDAYTIENTEFAGNGESLYDQPIVHLDPSMSEEEIRQIISSLGDDQTAIFAPGDYYFSDTLGVSGGIVTLEGEGNVNLILTNMYADVFSIYSDRIITAVTLRNLSMRHEPPIEAAPGDISCAGNVLSCSSLTQLIVEDCEFNGCGVVGIFTYDVKNISIRDSYFHHNSGWALYLDGCDNLEMNNSTVSQNGDCIYFNGDVIREEVSRETVSIHNTEFRDNQNTYVPDSDGYGYPEEGDYQPEDGDNYENGDSPEGYDPEYEGDGDYQPDNDYQYDGETEYEGGY